jgi:hypothetical protein
LTFINRSLMRARCPVGARFGSPAELHAAHQRITKLTAGERGRVQSAMVGLWGSVVENPHGLHWNTFKLSSKARLIVYRNVIGRPQTEQMTSLVGVISSLILYLWMQ